MFPLIIEPVKEFEKEKKHGKKITEKITAFFK